MNYCLKFPDEKTAIAAMPQYRTKDGEWVKSSHRHALNPFGTAMRDTGKMLVVDGIEQPERERVDGWHCYLQLLGGSDNLKNKPALHYCRAEKSAMSIEAGKPCNWCGVVEPTAAVLPDELQQYVVTPDPVYMVWA